METSVLGEFTANFVDPCIHTPPKDEAPIAGDQVTDGRWERTIDIELIVDGEIVDLNRIPLPADTPIIDERFKDSTKN